MEKLTQFVSKSFCMENNNSLGSILSETPGHLPENTIKSEDLSESIATTPQLTNLPEIKTDSTLSEKVDKPLATKPAAKNWLISNDPVVPKTMTTSHGIDLSLNHHANVIYTSSLILNQTRFEPLILAGSGGGSVHSQNLPKHENGKIWFDVERMKSSPPPSANSPTGETKNSFRSGSSSPIDLEDSKSCPEVDKQENDAESEKQENSTNNATENDKKICKYVLNNKTK